MKTGTVKRRVETAVDRTPSHMPATVTATRGSTTGLGALRAVSSVAGRGRQQGADSFRRWFAARPSTAAVLRKALAAYLTANGVDDAAARLVVLCADEALINAVAHGAGRPVGVFADLRDGHLTLEVSDGGSGFDPSRIDKDAEPDLMCEHGRGLFLIRNLMDDLEIRSSRYGTTIHMERDLRKQPPCRFVRSRSHWEATGVACVRSLPL